MNYKNIILALVFLTILGLFFVPTGQSTKAACGNSIECQIAVIMEQIRALQAQLAVLLSQQQQTQPWCYDFYTNFGIGTSNADFGALINVLDEENISEFASFNRPAFYNEVVAGAVVRLQAKYGILQTGYVGPITRAKLNALYGCGVVSIQPSVKIISPNGGETYNSGSSLNIIWTTTGIMPLETIDLIRLRSYTTGQEYNLAYTVFNDGQENVVIPSSVPAGPYLLEIKTYKNNVLVFDASDSYFKILGNNVQPSITVTSPSSGENWNGNNQNKITWTYSGNIYSQVDILVAGYDNWGNQLGDWKLIAAGVTTSQGYYYWVPSGAPLYMPTGLGNITFAPGTAKYKIQVREANDRADAIMGISGNYFNVTFSSINQPSISSVSPQPVWVGSSMTVYFSNGGSTGSVILKTLDGTKQWHIPYTTGNTVYNGFVYYDGSKVTFTVPFNIGRGLLPENTGYEVPISITSGTYNLFVYSTGGSMSNAFPITINTQSVQPFITITSPNGGEVWKYGETRRVTWISQGVNNVAIYIHNDTVSGSGSVNYLDPASASLSVPASQGYFDWTILQSWLPKTAYGNENRYKIRIFDNANNANYTATSDMSDNYFSIVATDNNSFIPWLQAKSLIENCNVKMVIQLHNLTVHLTLWNNTRLTTVEPVIDEVIRVVQGLGGRCGNIPIATE